jgi:sugar O-acyltransferase (sialic acid O-acetyltransferase NeuD family)
MIYLYGASGHGKVVIEIAELTNKSIAGLVDTDPAIKNLFEYPVSSEPPADIDAHFVISVGDNSIRKKIALELKGRMIETLVHPRSNLSQRANLGEGTVVMAGVTVNSYAYIGKHCILNTNASIDHDCHIEDFVHISPNVALAGNVTIGEGTHIGIGACVIQGINIGKWCTIGAGAVIIQDVPDGVTVVGNPGKIIK